MIHALIPVLDLDADPGPTPGVVQPVSPAPCSVADLEVYAELADRGCVVPSEVVRWALQVALQVARAGGGR